MQYGPQEVALFTTAEQRSVLRRQFPEWFNDHGHFVRDGYLAWSSQHAIEVRTAWLRFLKPGEIASVTNAYSIWFNIYNMKNAPNNFPSVRDWLKTVLPFWLENGRFDAMGFTSWYEYADFKDKEIVFKHLDCKEQKEVLRIWAFAETISSHHTYNPSLYPY